MKLNALLLGAVCTVPFISTFAAALRFKTRAFSALTTITVALAPSWMRCVAQPRAIATSMSLRVKVGFQVPPV